MTGDMAADVAAGALAARAVEPRAGEAAHGDAQTLCLNCGTRLIGEHCHRCGQSGHVHRTAGAIGHELAHGVFHFEGKIWRTLPMLALRPGELTRRYAAGERARFVSPLALFLFSVFLMFAVVANLPGAGFGDMEGVRVNTEAGRAEIAEQVAKAQASLARDERRLAALRRNADSDPDKAKRIAERAVETRQAIATFEAAQRLLPATDRDADAAAEPDSWIETSYRHAMENPKLLLYKVKTSAYKYSWALIPLSLPFIWLLFPLRRDVGLYYHAVFATYSLSFMSLLVVVLAVLAAVGVSPGLITLAGLIIAPLHIYKQLKGAYRLSRAGGLWRTAWMLLFALIATLVFVLLLLTVNLAE